MAKYRSELKAQIRAHWRKRAREEMERGGQAIPPDFQESLPTDGDLYPPQPNRIAQRAACLCAVALRGLVSAWPHNEQVEFLPQLLAWFRDAKLDDEIEQSEREVLNAPASELDDRSALNAAWRWEGAAVLLASLGRVVLPAFDQTIDPQVCGDAGGLFTKRDRFRELCEAAALSDSFDAFQYADRSIALHWRLRDFVQVKQSAVNFVEFAKGVQWAKFDLTGVPIAENDLAIEGKPIAKAGPVAAQRALSITLERHHAANWLIGWDPIYSAVETPT